MSNHPRRGHRRHPVTKTVGATGTILTLGAALVVATPGTAGAAPITVDSNLDNDPVGAMSLREAIVQANGTAEDDIISFAPSLNGQTITLTNGGIEISDGVTIQGPGAALLTVDGDESGRIFYLSGGEGNDVTIAGLTLTGGDSSGPGGGGGAIYSYTDGALILSDLHFTENYAETYGGGLYVTGAESVTITNSTFDHNLANGSSGGGARISDVDGAITVTGSTFDHNEAVEYGGGLSIGENDGATTISGSTFSTNYAGRGGGVDLYDTGNVSITTSTIIDNQADSLGGGLHAHDSSAVTITRSTISGNYVDGDGGGVYAYNNGTFTITNSTISGNEAVDDGGGIKFVGTYDGDTELVLTHSTVTLNIADEEEGGGLRLADTATIDHTIIAGNTGGDAIGNDGATADLSNSLIGEAEADLDGITITDGGNNAFSTDPGLGPLADNGGPTETHALLAGSAALNSGDPAFAPPPATDQRGEARVADVVIDKGAYEAQVDEPPAAPPAEPVPGAANFTG